jgi:hypothetical protein
LAGDDFRIIDHVIKALRRAGIPAEEIETFCDEVMSGGDRDLLLRARDEITESKEKNPAAGRNAGKESGVYA